MTSYLVELKITSDDPHLVELYEQAVKKMNSDEYKNNFFKDSGFDIYTPNDDCVLNPGETKLVNMKIKCAAYKVTAHPLSGKLQREPTAFFMFPRSSIYKSVLRLANNTGIIDSGYRGNLMGAFDNISSKSDCVNNETVGSVWIQKEQAYNRLLQICMPNLSPFSVEIVNTLNETARGDGGFGSTGK